MIHFEKLYQEYPLIDVIKGYGFEPIELGEGYELEECPFCGGHDCFRTFNNNKKWSCFQCPDNKISMDVIDFVSFMEDISLKKAISKLLKDSNIDLDEQDENIYAVKKLAESYYKTILLEKLDDKFVYVDKNGKQKRGTLLSYLRKYRGLSREFIETAPFGFSDGNLVSYLRMLDVPDKLISSAGFMQKDSDADYFKKDSFIFFHYSGNMLSHFSSDRGLMRKHKPLKIKKMYSGNSLFYLQETLTKKSTIVYLVEGQWDALAVRSLSIKFNKNAAVFASVGRMNTEQLRFLAELKLPIAELFDSDEGGKLFRNTLLEMPDIKELYDIPPEAFGEYKDVCELIADTPDEEKIEVFKSLLGESVQPTKYKIKREKIEKAKDSVFDQFDVKTRPELFSDISLERCLLKTLFTGENYPRFLELEGELFFKSTHVDIVNTAKDIIKRGRIPELKTISISLNLQDEFVDEIKESDIVDIDSSIDNLRMFYEKRVVLKTATSLENMIKETGSIEEFKQEYLRLMFDTIQKSSKVENDTYTAKDLPEQADKDIPEGGLDAGYTGYEALDEKLILGFYSGYGTLIAGRASAGKSMFKTNVIYKQCDKLKYGIISFTPENGNILDLARLDSLMLNEPFDEVLLAKKDSDLYKKRVGNWKYIQKNWAFVQCEGIVSVTRIISELLNAREAYPKVKKWIVYLDLADYLTDFENPKDRWFVIEKTLRSLRELSKPNKLDFAMVMLVHITRESSKKLRTAKERRPTIHDIRGSGAYENVSDLILMVHREAMYDDTLDEDIMEVIIGKQRGYIANTVVRFKYLPTVCAVEPFEDDEEVGEEFSDFELPEDL